MDAPTPECPQHPPWPAWATCSRCGGFICDECLRRAGLNDIPESGQCPKCERLAPKPIAIGGWLVFIGVQLAVAVLGCAWVIAIDVPEVARRPGVLLSLLMTGVQFGVTAVTGVAFLKRKRATVPLLFAFYLVAIVAAFMVEGTGRWLTGPSEFGGLPGMIRTFTFAGPWMIYLSKARRVSQTFVVP